MLNPDDRWIWDFWHVQENQTHHLFYLQAPKSLGDPELRHRNATIGHATSTDLFTWTEHGTVLGPGGPGSPDASATWTGSVVQGEDGLWRMFYTGSTFLSPDSTSNVEVILVAVSSDLHTWHKDDSFVLRADARWYEKLGDSTWPEEAWRDPWVYQDQDGTWHMLITARANHSDVMDRGVVGHATSPDLHTWRVQTPLSQTGEGFAQLEVLQKVDVAGRTMLLFSAHEGATPAHRHRPGHVTGTWIAPWNEGLQLQEAVNLSGPEFYSGRVLELEGAPVLLAFHLAGAGAAFRGGIGDPIALTWSDGLPTLLAPAGDS